MRPLALSLYSRLEDTWIVHQRSVAKILTIAQLLRQLKPASKSCERLKTLANRDPTIFLIYDRLYYVEYSLKLLILLYIDILTFDCLGSFSSNHSLEFLARSITHINVVLLKKNY